MKIKCERIKHESYTEKCSAESYCCSKMKQALNPIKSSDTSYLVKIFEIDKCGIKVATKAEGDCSPYPTDFKYISYCPFCGEEIKIAN